MDGDDGLIMIVGTDRAPVFVFGLVLVSSATGSRNTIQFAYPFMY
jgi:hypothetical protein